MSQNDKEPLELAAKAASYRVIGSHVEKGLALDDENAGYWDPLNDDGDTFRLAAAVGIDIFFMGSFARVVKRINDVLNWTDVRDPYSNMEKVRRAVVITAAEVGRAMP